MMNRISVASEGSSMGTLQLAQIAECELDIHDEVSTETTEISFKELLIDIEIETVSSNTSVSEEKTKCADWYPRTYEQLNYIENSLLKLREKHGYGAILQVLSRM